MTDFLLIEEVRTALKVVGCALLGAWVVLRYVRAIREYERETKTAASS